MNLKIKIKSRLSAASKANLHVLVQNHLGAVSWITSPIFAAH